MDSIVDALAYLAVAFALWEMLRNRDSMSRKREPWVQAIRDLGQK